MADALDPANASKATLKLENTEKRDALIAIEKKYQQFWAENKTYETDAPTLEEDPITDADELREKHPKFFGCMAYPYMNGTLHAGHSFSLSKVEFQTGYSRMQGKRALFPMGFHCTGMPIKACADKLKREVELFGQNFENCPEEDTEEPAAAPAKAATKEDITKFAAKKGKAAAKAVKVRWQFQIMLAIGIPLEDIHKFADPHHWLGHFPPLCKRDCNSIGLRVDWRRSMITTDVNPYYDAFVRWQMNRLRDLGKIKYGERYTIYSPKDGQPCMDHDRSDGEGVGPQEYTGIKIKVLEWTETAQAELAGKLPVGANVYMVAATLRPETMYGQTCCFVGPTITYGIYKISETEYYLCTERAARNMAYQKIFPKEGEFPCVATVVGKSLVGTLVKAPLSIHTDGVRVLPMETVLATKGTGVVTSVPSDSPDDYATVSDLAKKAEYYGIKKEWAELEIPEIIQTPSYGNKTAEFLVKKLKINSPKDAKQLAEAKELAYKEGFYQGIMLMGDFKGEKVEVAKPKVRAALIASGEAFAYAEPEGQVTSRSNDPCIVALLDQWYLDYGEAQWREQTENYVKEGLNSYHDETKNGLIANLGWLNQWACARSFGLGSKLPWDQQFLVESLSDSTIYMAYYTIAHYLHSSIDGKELGLAGITAEQMVDEVWDYLFCQRELPQDVIEKNNLPMDWLVKMRREFEYFYPLDVNISGKDLIQNHLTFFLYIHVAIFPPKYWPKGIRANGHLMLNGEKMSKSTGNFLTLKETVDKFGADAARIAFADAGDSVEDANFEEKVANAAILRLYTLKEWCEDIVKDAEAGKLRTGPKETFWDKIFENEMNELVAATKENYDSTSYKLALKTGYYEFQAARDTYREATSSIGMHKDLVLAWIKTQALMINPVAPHWAEYVWQDLLKNTGSIQNERFPVPTAPIDAASTAARVYVQQTASNITSTEAAQLKKKAKGKGTSYDPKLPKQLTIYVSLNYPSWQEKYIDLVRESFDKVTLTVNDKELSGKVAKLGETKKAMPFVQGLKKRLQAEDAETVFNRKLAFDEVETLKEVVPTLKKTTGCKNVVVVIVDEGGKTGKTIDGEVVENLPALAEGADPGNPRFEFTNIE
ncbi:leucyl-tRNA synthetase [Pyronema domesticum]|uniref:leucine--tRNA ligase n=1 Tax=Pyronema omphalodes (strain CBS 100304) TaxID=1076935 RepID=U4LUV4_PYROM|nr:leucyl-tRNA synthetase [Pyronema domesticum]CCX31976.1 Similar to Leucine--tRNA ligase, cytoplasmic; acc. no. P10857 [Pyronema omphalodes CBS 100304]